MSVIECLILDTPVVQTGVGGLGYLYNKSQELYL